MNNIVLNKLMYLVLLLVAVGLFFLNIFKVIGVILPFVIGWALSSVIYNSANFLKEKLKVQKALSYTIVLILLFGIIFLAAFGLATLVYFIVLKVSALLPNWVAAISIYSELWSNEVQGLFNDLPFNSAEIIDKVITSAFAALSQIGSFLATASLNLVKKVPNLFIGIIVTIISTFFFTLDRAKIVAVFKPLADKYITHNDIWKKLKSDIFFVIWGYIKAQLILMSITFAISSIGLLVIGVEQPFLKGFAVGLVDALPLLGPAAVYVPWGVSLIFVGKLNISLKIFVLYAVTTITRQFVEPKVLGEQIGIHPLLTLSALYIGVKLFGVGGLIIGPLLAVTGVAVYRQYVGKAKN